MFSIENFNNKDQKPWWKSFDFYKDNWTFLVFIPTAVGGLIQLIQLLSMDPSFVRFFAVEQVIPDGLLFVFLSLFCIGLALGLKKAYMPHEKINIGYNFKNIVKSIQRPVVISFCLIIILSFKKFYENDMNESVIFYLFLVSVKVVLFFLILEIIFILRYLHFFRGLTREQVKFELKRFDQHYYEFFKIKELKGVLFYSFLSFGSLFYILFTMVNVYKRVTTFDKLANEKIIISMVQNKYKTKENLSIKYYNGKYIFIRSVNNKYEEFIVLKGEALVDILKDEK
ncbi:hypothetical protein J537_0528 [Acinetobacter baumannii 1437282]|nr:hypothetical protein J537_0528 [Acinetobacter baumannii 1437282]